MQTFVHLACGLPIGLYVVAQNTNRENFPIVAAVYVVAAVSGSVAPDVPAFIEVFVSRLKSRKAFGDNVDETLIDWINRFHGTPVWLTLYALAFFGVGLGVTVAGFDLFMLVWVAAFGGLLHTAIDQITHGYPCKGFNKGRPNQHYWWPLPDRWGTKIHAFTAKITRGWDYRIAEGQLWPLREPEKWTVALALALSVSMILRGLTL